MPETRDAVPSTRGEDTANSQKRDMTDGALADSLWEQLRARQNGSSRQHSNTGSHKKQEDVLMRLGYYQEHGPRRFGDQEKRQPTMEERFWQFTPDVPESEESDDSAEERELVRL